MSFHEQQEDVMRDTLAVILSFVLYLVGMSALSFWCRYLTGEVWTCFRMLDGFGSVAGMVLIIPLFLVIRWLLSFVMK